MLQLLNAFNSGEKGAGGSAVSSAIKSQFKGGEEQKKIEPLSFGGLPEETKSKAPVRDSTDKHLAKANNLLAELEQEKEFGYNLRESHDDDFDMGEAEQ